MSGFLAVTLAYAILTSAHPLLFWHFCGTTMSHIKGTQLQAKLSKNPLVCWRQLFGPHYWRVVSALVLTPRRGGERIVKGKESTGLPMAVAVWPWPNPHSVFGELFACSIFNCQDMGKDRSFLFVLYPWRFYSLEREQLSAFLYIDCYHIVATGRLSCEVYVWFAVL